MVSDLPVVYQSRRLDAYREALTFLQTNRHTFRCACSRRVLQDAVYAGTCRDRSLSAAVGRSIRLRAADVTIEIQDALQGTYRQHIAAEVGDFVIRRADNIIAYHLAVVVDDAWQQITEIVRGVDLLDSTPRQVYLQGLLGLPSPAFVHLPVVVDQAGVKLSKQTGALSVDAWPPRRLLHEILKALGQQPPGEIANVPVREAMEWAARHWTLTRVPGGYGVPAPP